MRITGTKFNKNELICLSRNGVSSSIMRNGRLIKKTTQLEEELAEDCLFYRDWLEVLCSEEKEEKKELYREAISKGETYSRLKIRLRQEESAEKYIRRLENSRLFQETLLKRKELQQIKLVAACEVVE